MLPEMHQSKSLSSTPISRHIRQVLQDDIYRYERNPTIEPGPKMPQVDDGGDVSAHLCSARSATAGMCAVWRREGVAH
jgi:hypothetical protein